MKFDCVVLGSGPAGITAAIYLKRYNNNVVIISNNESNLLKAEQIDNYYGFPNGISGEKLFNDGILQAKNLGIEVIEDEVLNISYNEDYLVECKKNNFLCNAVILATGNKKKTPKIEGIYDYEGKGISYCAIFDSFFYRKKIVGVLGSGDYAIHEANVLKNVTNNITIYTNGEKINTKDCEINVCEKKITAIRGNERVEELVFSDGTKDNIDGLFIALGSAGTSDLALKLGVITENNKVVVNERMETNIKGIYCCGDATGGLLQISKAVYEGTVAGLEVNKFLKK